MKNYEGLNVTLVKNLRRKIEELKQSEAKYRTILENTTDIIYSYLPDGTIVYISPQISMIGYTPEEVIGKNLIEFVHPDDRKHVLADMRDTIETGKDFPTVCRIVKKDRGFIWIEELSRSVNEDGRTVKLTGVIRNITERKQAEEKIALFKYAVECSSDAIGVSTPEGRHWYQNKAFNDLFGDVGSSPPDSLYVDSKQGHEIFKTIMSGNAWTGEVKMNSKDKKVLDILLHADSIKDDNGKIVGLIGAHIDITEKKEVEEKLKESEELLHAIFDGISDGLIVADAQNNRFVYANRQICRITGYTEKELLSLNVNSLHTKKDLPYVLKQFGRMAKGEISVVKNIPVQRKDRTIVHCDISAKIINVNGKRCMAGIFRDASKEKIADDKIKESEERYRTLYNSSTDAIMTLEPPKWKFTSGNPATVKMFRAKNEKDFTSHGPGQVSPKYQPDGQLSAVKAKKMIMHAMKEGSNFFEWTHRRINGEEFPATVLLTRLTIGGKTFLQATVRDITALKTSSFEEQFKLFVDNAPDLIQSIKPDGSFNYVNKEWKKVLGYSDKEIKKMKLWNVLKKEHIKPCMKLFKTVMSGHKLTGVRTEFVSKNKKPVALIGDINPIKKDGKVIETIGVFRREDKDGHLLKTC